MKTPAFVFDYSETCNNIKQLASTPAEGIKRIASDADKAANAYYAGRERPQLLWVRRTGVDDRADSLLSILKGASMDGLSEEAFFVGSITRDLNAMRNLSFDKQTGSINHLAARLEYMLTLAFFRYAAGQRFGFCNPYKTFNHLDVEKQDSVRKFTIYRGLYDADTELPTDSFFTELRHWITEGQTGSRLQQLQPTDKIYHTLKEQLHGTTDEELRIKILCNMERRRWRARQPLNEGEKRIVVNIPAFELYAYGGDSVTSMKVVCGAVTTKTPQLNSNIEWMEVNPVWVIPKSIVEHDVSRHAGDESYFERNRYDIFERATNQQFGIAEVSRAMLLSGKYKVVQRGGAGNSLGRIVFRFKNKFSVFLHDTSTPSAFLRESRAASHGCVRVSRPFDLSQFVLEQPEEWLSDRIRIAMGIAPETDRGKAYVRNHTPEECNKIVGYVPVKPRVPIYIIYQTMWPDTNGVMTQWPDIYGYDNIIMKQIAPYIDGSKNI